MSDWGGALDEAVDTRADELRAFRRHLHAHPEPSHEEYGTTELLAARLREAGLAVRIPTSRRGLIAGPESDGTGIVAIRGDIDALRIHDLKDVGYRSTRDGVMHACGHDAHATMVLGAAEALWSCRNVLPESVRWRAVFQPAEETGLGAREMIEAGAVEGVRAIVALHVDPELETGCVAQRSGVMTAFCSDLRVVVKGVGGHAARPHQSTDPIAVAVQFVSTVYQFVPRSVDSREAAVITFGSIHGGGSANAIPERVELAGTIRTLSWSAAVKVEERLRQIGAGLAEASGAEIEIRIERGVDAVVNDRAVNAACVLAASEVVGPGQVRPIALPSMGGEDFAGYLAHTPGCLLRLGVASENRPRHFLHSPHFDIDERALTIGAKVLARSVVHLSLSHSSPGQRRP
ncbi:MAG: amidohydrolase [Isosphaeraceae bacterium]